jgi:hypothetical protein
MTIGSVKTSVLPEPVKAMPMRSRPVSATGSPCTWMGVGRSMPLALSASRMGLGKRMSAKDLMGGGTPEPAAVARVVMEAAGVGV